MTSRGGRDDVTRGQRRAAAKNTAAASPLSRPLVLSVSDSAARRRPPLEAAHHRSKQDESICRPRPEPGPGAGHLNHAGRSGHGSSGLCYRGAGSVQFEAAWLALLSPPLGVKFSLQANEFQFAEEYLFLQLDCSC